MGVMPDDPHKSHTTALTPPMSETHARKNTRRHVMVTRDYGLPDVTRMIGDAYHVVDQQLGQFRAESSHEKFDVKSATVLHKLVCTLQILEAAEQKRISNLQLNALSKESLELLAEQASKFGDADE